MTDEKILELYAMRSERAIEECDKTYGNYCRTVAARILTSPEDAEECVNDAYFKVWSMIPPEKPNSLKTFLGKITRQLSINRLAARNMQKRNSGEYLLALDELQECIPDNSNEDLGELVALRDVLNRFLRTLPVTMRRVFIKRYWYIHSVSDIAKEFSFSESKVKSMLMRTRERLKQYLISEGFTV